MCVPMHNIFFHFIYRFANCTVVHLHPGTRMERSSSTWIKTEKKDDRKATSVNIYVLYLDAATMMVP